MKRERETGRERQTERQRYRPLKHTLFTHKNAFHSILRVGTFGVTFSGHYSILIDFAHAQSI